MEKRIRIVWILSLISVFLLITVQGYWLYNQYTYVINTYTEELAQEIMPAINKEYDIRKKHTTAYTFMMNSNAEYTADKNGGTLQNQMHFSYKSGINIDSIKLDSLSLDSLRDYTRKMAGLTDRVKSTIDNKGVNDSTIVKGFRFNVGPVFSQAEVLENVSRAVTNSNHPFRRELVDSILLADFPELSFTISDWAANDTTYISQWKCTGNIFKPGLRVAYAYSPFQEEGVYIYTDIPTQPVFKKMGIQLLLALGIILLLIVCLVFQIKTILKQKKIGELRQNFVNTMIHELKRPVQTLKTFVAFLGDKEMCADEIATKEVVQDAMFELDNLSAYLNKLKDMVRADNEDTPLHLTPFNLSELVEKVIRLIHIPEQKQVTFTTDFVMESPHIEADPIHLANVLSNLIENAIKYSNSQVQIGIKASRIGRELSLTVSDNGIGIPLVEQDKVFAKFYRGSNLPDRNIPGLGLGLSYVKLISEAHQGQVFLKSAIGQGTSVTLCIPQ